MTTYRISHAEGWAPNDHFGREILRRLKTDNPDLPYPSLADARAALVAARTAHGGAQPGRFDIRSSDGKVWSWV